MFTCAGCVAVDVVGSATHRYGVTNDVDLTQPRMLYRCRHFQVLHLGVGERFVDAIDWPTGDTDVVQHADPMRGWLFGRVFGYRRVEGIAIGRSQRPYCVVRVLGKFVGSNSGAQRSEAASVRGRQIHMAVGGRERSHRNQGRVIVPGLRRDFVIHRPTGGLEVEHGDLRFE